MQLHRLIAHTRVAVCVAFALSACSPPTANTWSGYAESDPIWVAAPVAGRLQQLAVQAGARVGEGELLFALDDTPEQADLARAAAQLSQAQAQSHNLETGRRDAELRVTRAQLAQAQALLAQARANHQRLQALQQQDFISPAQLEAAAHSQTQAAAKVAELQALLQASQLPARGDERAASQANVTAAQQALRAQDWRAAQAQAHAPQAGWVEDTFFQVGEWVAAGQPVVALRGANGLKLRFFVPQGELASLRLGQVVSATCDGCPAPVAATIRRIANAPEYTPPVIYAKAQRAKLVFVVEASVAPDAPIHPGQPVDIAHPASGS